MDAILSDPWALCGSPVVLGILGLLIGSFLNVVIYRKPIIMMREWLLDTGGMLGEGEVWKTVFGKPQPAELTDAGKTIDAHLEALTPLGLATPRSRCGACGHPIRWYENIPLVSWLALRGKCSACKTPISRALPARRARHRRAVRAGGLALRRRSRRRSPGARRCALLVAMALIDLDTKYLPDDLTYPLLWGGLVVAALGWTIPLPRPRLGRGRRLPVAVAHRRRASSCCAARKAWAAATSSCWPRSAPGSGWQAILPIILLAVGGRRCASACRADAAARRTSATSAIPFGPFLAGGGLVVMFVGADALCCAWAGIGLPD